jgi:hypothetical protein
VQQEPKPGRLFGPKSVAMWSVIGGVCTLIALIVTLFALLPHGSTGQNNGGHLDVHGIWDGELVGSTGTLAYHLTLTQNGTHVTGQARGQDPANQARYVVFSVDGQVDQQTFAFEETSIVDSNPSSPGAWCMISASLRPAGDGVLAGNWNTTIQNDPSCGGINGNLTIHRS